MKKDTITEGFKRNLEILKKAQEDADRKKIRAHKILATRPLPPRPK